ncbi:hypothetical protein PCASD_13932 [Puccinia coronata f. sp. avenae]|uniref:DUF7872 domain-containing protein n=1 Tax=Puccinia coronata f. sp. avenae TaxID=200324 RepID=A0A2N5UH86_9BASI|nr:hypothetical protein PCASD_13932 [Puccinia coronata f. sp. avenae]
MTNAVPSTGWTNGPPHQDILARAPYCGRCSKWFARTNRSRTWRELTTCLSGSGCVSSGFASLAPLTIEARATGQPASLKNNADYLRRLHTLAIELLSTSSVPSSSWRTYRFDIRHISGSCFFYLEGFGVSARTTAVAPADSTTAQIQFSGQYPPKNPSCKALPLTVDTWNQLKLNDYLSKYPGGDKLNLQDYATKVNITNFSCGVGAACNVGQPCYPLETVDWYILFAVQQWNSYLNIYYEAVGYGIAIVEYVEISKATSSHVAAAAIQSRTFYLIIICKQKKELFSEILGIKYKCVDSFTLSINGYHNVLNMKNNLGISAALSQVSATATGPWGLALNVANFLLVVGQGTAGFAIKEPPAPLQDGFYQWSNVAYYLSQYEEVIHQKLSEESKNRFAAGISTDQGIFGVVKDGNTIVPANFPNLPDLEDQVRNLTLALGVNMLLHSINAFITVGSDPCNDKERMEPGPKMYISHGATHLAEPCIILFWQKMTRQSMKSMKASVLSEYFGISTELIVTSSIKCQNFNKGWNYVPWAQDKGALPKAADSDCVFNLPVCYTQDPEIHKKIHKKKWTTVKACRHNGGLPI